MKAVSALREAGCEVTGMVATFTYGFRVSEKTFAENDLKVRTLTDYETMLEQAVESGYLEKKQLPLLQEWRLNPAGWNTV